MDNTHPFARNLMEAMRLDAEGLHRVGLFLLAHARVDFHLIAAVSTFEMRVRREAAGRRLGYDESRRIVDEASEGTFGIHLTAAKARGLLTPDVAPIAEELNRARNAFLHWQRDRFSLPVYKGQSILTDEGLHACLLDVVQFTHAMPFVTDF